MYLQIHAPANPWSTKIWRCVEVFAFATCTSPIMHLICPPPKTLHSLCFSFLLGIYTAIPRGIENNAHAKFCRVNEVHYGRCTSGELKECHFWQFLNTLWKSPKGLLNVSDVNNSMQKPRQISTMYCAIWLVGFWPITILVKYLTIWLPCFMFSDQEQLK